MLNMSKKIKKYIILVKFLSKKYANDYFQRANKYFKSKIDIYKSYRFKKLITFLGQKIDLSSK